MMEGTDTEAAPQMTAEVFLALLRSMEPEEREEAGRRLITLRRVVAALDKAAANPDWWKVNRLVFFCPEMTRGEIARFLKIKTATVKHYIKHAEIGEEVYDNLPPVPEKEKTYERV